VIVLVPMAEAEYDAFYETVIHDYAEGLVRAGNARPDLALQVSRQQCAPVLENGIASPGQRFYLIRETVPPEGTGAHVGYLWWGVREQYGTRVAMLYFVGVFEGYRRRGYATQALRRLEDLVAREGLDDLRLYVFGHNGRAQRLYEKMGYAPVSLVMGKRIVARG
jgi:ribosomal protein S18 acetylase RimI-like enzyme